MKHFVYGNGESRKGFPVKNYGGVSWGCNAIYRDTPVDNLVVLDYAMQGEVYDSSYAEQYQCWFADWNPVPADSLMLSTFTQDFTSDQIFKYGFDTGMTCVINGSHPTVVQQRINAIKDDFPHLDPKDLAIKMKKDIGLHIIFDNPERDKIKPIEEPKDWSAGTTAVHLACQNGAIEVYMFGFDLSSYDERINNIYKGSKNYLPETAKGFNTSMWRSQLYMTFREFSNVKFKWVGNDFRYVTDSKIMDCENVDLLTYDNIGDIR